ncbi:prephenate dehydrogenase [Streptomyces sp. NBC_01304]|uniref:prephenate dehydrogenase n=1 Tax=Streptomyces sp. NBC_01304 TaxID=2903818 RepID=UPI002E15E3AE|nr:prephenate dehydrogenase [Streptomyces sp. NBC_01304]
MAVVGTGLIGTSIGLAVSRHGVTVHLLDKDEVAARTAAALGAGVVGASDEQVDLAVLAVPPSAVGEVLAEMQARGLARSYTDVASVKAQLARDIRTSVDVPSSYVGGHPLASSEHCGPLAARADLFEDRAWVLTPSETTSQDAVNRVFEMIALCGAIPVIMESGAHDNAVALTSHAPHLVASLMAARLRHSPREAIRLAGQGLHDMTRIAVRDTGLWSDILQANGPAVAGVLRGLRDDLTTLLATLDDLSSTPQDMRSQSLDPLVDLLDRGAAGLAAIQGRQAADRQTRVEVQVAEGPGQLVRLLDTLKTFHVEAEDVVPRHSPEEGTLSLTFAVQPTRAGQIVLELGRAGWNAESLDPVSGARQRKIVSVLAPRAA